MNICYLCTTNYCDHLFNVYLVMAGLEGAPGAMESHLHRREGQIGHKIFTTLRITVLHLEESKKE